MGKWDANKKLKRDSLLNTSFELFTSQGINQTSISDIVKKAGVAKGTFYPLSVSTKMLGMSIKMYDMGVNVTEKQVTFNPADYPGVTIIDER